MHPFPPADDLEFLIGEELIEVALQPHALNLAFESGVYLRCEHCIEYVEPDGRAWGYDCANTQGDVVPLHRLVQKRITALDRRNLRLSLTFNDGSILRVFSAIGPYESGQIGKFEGVPIVF